MTTYRDYLENDHHIFPLHRFQGDVCECGNQECKAIGKHPIMSNWQYVTVWDDEQLANLENETGLYGYNKFESGFGVNLQGRNLLVVDIDARNGGVESAAQFAHILAACTFVVKTGSGGGSKHYYFYIPEAWRGKALRSHLETAKGIDFKSTGFVVGAGSLHKSGNRYEAIIGDPGDISDAPESLLQMLLIPERQRTTFEGKTIEYTDDELHDIVMAIRNDAPDYDKWIRVGMGIHHATGGNGYDLWVKWSAKCKQAHDDTDMPMKWGSFGRSANTVTIGTLMTWAKQDGYETPVTFTDDTEWEPLEAETTMPADTVGINLLRPPGFVGKIVDWINSRCMYPRERLAVAAALQIVGNAAALRYRVAPLDTTLNLMTFGVAGSGSGKGAILDCVQEVHREIGLGRVLYGGVKSEQEILRNAIRHQPVYYTVDEAGSLLAKVSNARKNGGKTSYLEAVPATLMSLYSHADKVFAVTGDLKEEIMNIIEKEVARIQKKLDKGEGTEDELEAALKSRGRADAGIVNPVMSFFGVTEPSAFSEAINNDRWLVVGGFLGRFLIFEELDNVPRRKPLDQIKKDKLPDELKIVLMGIFNDGNYSAVDADYKRIENRGETKHITMTEDAMKEAERIEEYWYLQARKEQDDGTGLEQLAQRANELTLKIAGILSVQTMVITKENLLWAYALVKHVTQLKISKVKAVDGSESKDAKEKGEGILEAIKSVLGQGSDYYTEGVIANRYRTRYTKDNIVEGLNFLVANGEVLLKEVKDGTGRMRKRYTLARGAQ